MIFIYIIKKMFLRRITFYSVCIIFAVAVLLIMRGKRYSYTSNYYYPSYENYRNILHMLKNREENIPTTYDGYIDMDKLLDNTLSQIKLQLNSYNYSFSGARDINDLLLGTNGQPMRTVIISTWGSGSTFLGEILNAMPGSFYHYEPLVQYGNIQIRGPPHASDALSVIKSMFKCEYEDLNEYFDYGRKLVHHFNHNSRLWDQYCRFKKELCFDSDFTGNMCKLFPFQVMKIARLRLRLIQKILEDYDLNVKAILLIRDPRGVLQSRQHREFCLTSSDCWRPDLLCADMVNDYVAAGRLLKLFPGRLSVQRYEELALEPNSTTLKLFKFLGMSVTPKVEEYLRAHTKFDVAGVDSTFRISKDVPFKWKTTLDFSYVEKIQSLCSEAMSLWGYRAAHNASHMASRDFFPLDRYTIE